MKVAIDSGPLEGGHAVRGVGVYTRNLIVFLKKKRNISVESFDFKSKKDTLGNFDIIHYPYFDPYFLTLPLSRPAKTVVTIHDLIPLVYPKHYPPGLRGRIKAQLQKMSLKSVSAVITDTESSKKDIVRFLAFPEDKIYPIHLAPGDSFKPIKDKRVLKDVKEKYSIPDEFVLYVGDINYNKNILNLISACTKIDAYLVIVGKQAETLNGGETDLMALSGPRDWLRYLLGGSHPELTHLKELARKFRDNPKVIRVGYISCEDLNAIYSLATVYCQPSLYEGFGIPPLEAMASQCPVVANRTQALVEVLEGAVIFADAEDPKDLSDALLKVIKSDQIKKDLIKKGREKIRNFSWDDTADKTLQVYEKIYRL